MLRAFLALGLIALATPVGATPPNVILKAEYIEPTRRYDHGILGDAIEWGALKVTFDACAGCPGASAADHRRVRIIRLPASRVFEDIAPRIITDEFTMTYVLVVETDLGLGARLAIYDTGGLAHATPFIGRSHRWLAPVGAADLDGDGVPEIAYVEKPHLSKVLKVWRFHESGLQLVATLPGLANHRIGQDFITGGIRECAGAPEIITADAGWTQVMATRLRGDRLSTRAIAPFSGPNIRLALACKL
ncbi:MAG: VCBS repeat-containing protein [Paracoccaceae bacterium]